MSQHKPLSGLRVLELARILAGPWCGQMLADLGADVVKVEAPEGDDTRRWGPPFVAARDGGHLDAAYFHSTNRGKRSIVADFRNEADLAMVRSLAGHADVLIENFKVGGLKKYGLDFATLSAFNPRLVYCSITGFGQTGPYAPRPGYDFIIQGMGGLMDVTGEPEREPQKVGVAVADIFTGTNAAVAVLAALRQRDVTDRGCHVDMALLDAQVSILQAQALNYLTSGREPKRMGNAHPNLVPYQLMPVSDGHLILAVGNDAQYARACEVLGCGELVSDPRFVRNADRIQNRDALMALLFEKARSFTKADLLARLEAAGVPAGPVNTVPEVFADPQVVHRAMKHDLPSSESAAGTIPTVRNPLIINGDPLISATPSPRLGADRASVLADPFWGGTGKQG